SKEDQQSLIGCGLKDRARDSVKPLHESRARSSLDRGCARSPRQAEIECVVGQVGQDVLFSATEAFVTPAANEHGPNLVRRVVILNPDRRGPRWMQFIRAIVAHFETDQSSHDAITTSPITLFISFSRLSIL